mmetsp:Transcript_14897/g.24251  ORF Transcript_14897/g.24251 Transcript_14897/m.24251 type:complete len:349 (-) Transcript_14897:1510-2556(-)
MFTSRLTHAARLASHRAVRGSKRFCTAAKAGGEQAPKQPSGGGGVGAGPLAAVAITVGAVFGYFFMQAEEAMEYGLVRQAIAESLDDDDHDDGSLGPIFVRLAWHNAGTYDKNTGKGGSEGAGMRFSPESDWGANAGLGLARARLEPIKAKFPGISYSDLWALAGNTAIEEMGGPSLPFRHGRKDKTESDPKLPDGLLPDADGRDHKDKNPADHLRDIFYRMGLNDQEIVALSGAHALGRCHETSSGFWGPWTRAPTTFSNEYFKLLLDEKWTVKKKHNGKKWTGPEQYEDKTGELMMLPTDIVLVKDKEMKKWVETYAKDEDRFFNDFAKAWTKLQENGCKNLAQAK